MKKKAGEKDKPIALFRRALQHRAARWGTPNSEPYTLHPKLETRNPKPGTRDPKLRTRNSKSKTTGPKLETQNPKTETHKTMFQHRTARHAVRAVFVSIGHE